jgi:hypothetical protein
MHSTSYSGGYNAPFSMLPKKSRYYDGEILNVVGGTDKVGFHITDLIAESKQKVCTWIKN